MKNWQVIVRTIAELTKDVVSELNIRGYQGRTVTLKLRFEDFHTITKAHTMPTHSASEERIRKAVFHCLKRIDLTRKVRLVGVRITNLERPSVSS